MNVTYIIKTESNEFYCGKTNCLFKKLGVHSREKHPGWFACKGRKDFKVVFVIRGDHVRKIKDFGIGRFVRCLDERLDAYSISIYY